MIYRFYDDIVSTKASLLVNPVDCMGEFEQTFIKNNPEYSRFLDENPHISKEILKYIRFCQKKKRNPYGTVQYVPVDSWALIMCDTMNNDKLAAYDSKYQYIVNLFGYKDFSSKEDTFSEKVIRNALLQIKEAATNLGANVAIPNYMFCRNQKQVDVVNRLIDEVFNGSGLGVEIYDVEKYV